VDGVGVKALAFVRAEVVYYSRRLRLLCDAGDTGALEEVLSYLPPRA